MIPIRCETVIDRTIHKAYGLRIGTDQRITDRYGSTDYRGIRLIFTTICNI